MSNFTTHETREERENRSPCIDDLIEHLRLMRELHGNIVVVRDEDEVQSPGEYYDVNQFFFNWPDV
jgi:hypothetical protein